MSLEDLRREPKVYLLPECEKEEEAREYLQEVCSEIFEDQLDGSTVCLPRGRTGVNWTPSNRWFEWSLHSMVVDLCAHPLLQEEM